MSRQDDSLRQRGDRPRGKTGAKGCLYADPRGDRGGALQARGSAGGVGTGRFDLGPAGARHDARVPQGGHQAGVGLHREAHVNILELTNEVILPR